MGGFGVNPVLDGLMQAFSMANVIKHQRMQSEQLQLQKNRDQRQQEHEKFNEGRQTLSDRMTALGSGAKPLDERGQYSRQDSLSMGPNLPEALLNVQAPADPSRVADIGGQKYQLATKAEQDEDAFTKATRISQASINAHATSTMQTDAARLKAQHDERQITLPGMTTPVDARAVPFITEQTRAKTQEANTALTRKSAETIADKNNASRERAAGIREAARGKREMTAGQNAVNERFKERQQDAAKKDNEKDQVEEQALWKKLSDAKEDLRVGKTLDHGQEVDLNALITAGRKADAVKFQSQINQLQQRQKARTEKFGGTYSNGADAPAAGANPYR
jgi:hypothetical protein